MSIYKINMVYLELFFQTLLLKFFSLFNTFVYLVDNIDIASRAELMDPALPIASVPTGIPLGI